jgi:tetratricopeptide (TPR) repeat protein
LGFNNYEGKAGMEKLICEKMLLLALALFSLAACSSADNIEDCNASMQLLIETVEDLEKGVLIDDHSSIDKEIRQVRNNCDITQFQTGMLIVHALKRQNEVDEIEPLLDVIKSRNKQEEMALHYEKAFFYIDQRKREDASKYVLALENDFPDTPEADSQRVRFECVFNRCGTVLELARALSKYRPEEKEYTMLLAFAYADMHDFHEAASQFDLLSDEETIGKLDSKYALIAITSYSNTGQKEKAVQFYEKYKKLDKHPRNDDKNYEMMKQVIENKDEKRIFLFSEWPIKN